MPMSAVRYGRRSPMMIASLMYGDALSAFSISLGAMFLPPEVMMMSLARSVIFTWVPSTDSPRSPVCSQPSGSLACAVASGLRKYPTNTPAWRVWISPVFGSIRSSTPGRGSPTVPSSTRPRRLAVATVVLQRVLRELYVGHREHGALRRAGGAGGVYQGTNIGISG